jgi:hypothetical protein
MDDKARYVALLLERYRKIPATAGRNLRVDRRTARDLYDRRIDLPVVYQAFVLALARRAFSPNHGGHEPIRTLSYFLPVIAEILTNPPDPAYLLHLERRLRTVGLHPSD